MKLSDTVLLIILAAIWGSSFVFMRASVDAFGPIMLNAIRIGVAALFMSFFLINKRRRNEFLENWQKLMFTGLINSAIPFCLLAYASLSLTGGTVSIINAMTPLSTALVAHLWLKDSMTKLQFLGLAISLSGLVYLFNDQIKWSLSSWLPMLAGFGATILYGLATNTTKRYLSNVSVMTASAGSLFFSAIAVLILAQFFLPDFSKTNTSHWVYASILGILCTAIAFIIYFKLVKTIGPSKTASVTFLIPVFAFLWGYLLLGEVVTTKMWIATLIILLGMSLITGIVNANKTFARLIK